jgi:hypothetical protein
MSLDFAALAGARFVRGSGKGHYESWFVRANHPEKALAFWCRYTVFSPRGAPDRAVAELWSIFFDGERAEIVAAKEDVDLSRASFGARGLDVRIGDALLDERAAIGAVRGASARLAWDLCIRRGSGVALLIPKGLYRGPFPKAKSVVLDACARFSGTFEVRDRRIPIEGWVGSVNHNWGSEHTERYAWGQIAGFDGAPDAFFECTTARALVTPRFGGVRFPWATLAVLRWEGRTYDLTTLVESLRARARYDGGDWTFDVRGRGVEILAHIHAPESAFAALEYRNPPGGTKLCHNTKIGSAEVRLRERGREVWLTARSRAAFEVLTDLDGPVGSFAPMSERR